MSAHRDGAAEETIEDRIIHCLLGVRTHISGEEIARLLRVSRTAVWNHVSKLRSRGFRIESVPHLGHRLVEAPDLLLPSLVAYGLETRVAGRRIVYCERTTSSSDVAEQLARAGEPEGTVVIAEEQTKGRGRIGRHWHSPVGKGIYLSLIVRPSLSPAKVSFLTLLSAVCAQESIADFAGVRAFLKWPNDVLVAGGKVCGILTELNTEADRINYAIVGVGINVNHSAQDLHGVPGATSLRLEAGTEISRLGLLQSFLRAFDRRYMRLREERYKEIRDAWLEASATVGRRVAVKSLAGEGCEGIATGIDEDGCLLLRLDNGTTRRVTGGDVTLVA
ncbi:MAG: biotin--[acetyl-CoA-carboxylase] ligase [Candidatus Aureabacteria bacterium]|nr:biotin--[acetyl-CoA-carboxylase] ligase [Candidatus Auribacterota bacterium]